MIESPSPYGCFKQFSPSLRYPLAAMLGSGLSLALTGSAFGADVYFKPSVDPVVSAYYGAPYVWADSMGNSVGMPGASDVAYISGFKVQLDSTVNLNLNVTNSRLILSRKVQINLNSLTYTVTGRTDLNTDAQVTVGGGNFNTSILNFLSNSPETSFTIKDDAKVKVSNTSPIYYSVVMEGSSHFNVHGSLVCTGQNFAIGVDSGFPHMTIAGLKAAVSTPNLLIAADSQDADAISGSGDLAISDGGQLNTSSLIFVGVDGPGSLEVSSGGSITTPLLSLGRGVPSTGTMVIDGPASAVHVTSTDAGALRIGRDGAGFLTLQNGASLDTTSLELGYSAKSGGKLLVDGDGSLLISSGPIAVGGSKSAAGGSGQMTISGSGLVSSSGPVTFWPGSSLALNGGSLQGNQGVSLNGATLSGSGTISASVTSKGATYQPGNSLKIQGDWSLSGSDSLQLELSRYGPDVSDSVIVEGQINLNGANLNLPILAARSSRRLPGVPYVLIHNRSGKAINGVFAGITEGTVLQLDGRAFTASYLGGDGYDFTITPVPEPPAQGWKADFFASADAPEAADDADPDGDGLSNFWERAYGFSPLSPNAGYAPEFSLDLTTSVPDPDDSLFTTFDATTPSLGGFMNYTYRRSLAATDLNFQVEWSDDLIQWSSDGVIDSADNVQDGVEIRTAKVPVSPSGSGRFLRLSVTPASPPP